MPKNALGRHASGGLVIKDEAYLLNCTALTTRRRDRGTDGFDAMVCAHTALWLMQRLLRCVLAR
jgi:hypothetical protein